MKLKVIESSVRQGRLSERVTKWVCAQLDMAKVEYELLDLKDYQMPLVDTPDLPMSLDKKYPHELVQKWSAKIDDGDAYIMITPEYNHGYPASLKNAIDWLGMEWWGKPVGFVSYSTGRNGGSRAVAQLRQVVINFNMYDLRNEINLAQADKAISEDGQPQEKAINEQLQKLVNELNDLSKKLKV